MLTVREHRVNVSAMSDNSQNTRDIIQRLMVMFKCQSTGELANYLNGDGEQVVYPQTISRWLRRGMYKSTLAIIRALLDKNEALESKTKKLERRIIMLEKKEQID